jgi:triacylglycerol lipase
MSILLRARPRSPAQFFSTARAFSAISRLQKDPRLEDLGKVIEDEFAVLRDNYGMYAPFTEACQY